MSIGIVIPQEGAVKPSSLEQETFEYDLFASRITEIPTNMQMRADYGTSTDGLPDYVGYAPKGLTESGTNGWLLQKFVYDANRQCTSRTIAYGSWTNRTTESYS